MHWLDVIDGIDFVESDWFDEEPGDENKQENCELYERVLRLTKKFLGME